MVGIATHDGTVAVFKYVKSDGCQCGAEDTLREVARVEVPKSWLPLKHLSWGTEVRDPSGDKELLSVVGAGANNYCPAHIGVFQVNHGDGAAHDTGSGHRDHGYWNPSMDDSCCGRMTSAGIENTSTAADTGIGVDTHSVEIGADASSGMQLVQHFEGRFFRCEFVPVELRLGKLRKRSDASKAMLLFFELGPTAVSLRCIDGA